MGIVRIFKLETMKLTETSRRRIYWERVGGKEEEISWLISL